MRISIFILLGTPSALRFNEVESGIDLDVVEGRRRRRKGVGFYDSPNVEYIVKYPGARITTASKVTAYQDKLAEDIGALVFTELQKTAGVTETILQVNAHMKKNLKVADWTLSTSLMETKAPHFTDIITWPENPGWKTISPVSPNVFDSLFKRIEFTTLLQAKLRAESVKVGYTGYGVDGAPAAGDEIVVVERTVSTSSVTGTFKIRVSFSDPAGGVPKPVPASFASEVAATKPEDEGNSQALLAEAKKALAGAFGVSTDFLSVERSDHMVKLCSTQIMFNFPTTSETKNLKAVANALSDAAILDRSFHQVFTRAAATVLGVDEEKVEMNTFLSRNTGGAGATGDNERFIDMQLRYQTPCTLTLNTGVPFWYEAEAFRVHNEIGDDNAKHLIIANKILTEATKSSPFLVTFTTPALETAFDALVVGTGAPAANPKHIMLPVTVLSANNLKQGLTDCAGGVGTGCVDRVYQNGKGLKAIGSDAADMNTVWNAVDHLVGTAPITDISEFRIKYVIGIKNAIDSNAATLVKSYVAMADASADDTDAFSVKVKDSMAASKGLLSLGCSVTNVWMKSEATSTTF